MEMFQIVLISSLIVNVITLIILFAFYQSQKRVLDVSPFIRNVNKLRNLTAKKEEKILREAVRKSKSTVEETLTELEGVENLSEEAKNDLQKQTQELVQQSISKDSQVFQNIIKDITETYKTELQNLNNLQKEEYSKLFSSSKTAMEAEIANLSQEVARISTEGKAKVEAELSAYKQKVKTDLDQRVFSVLSDVAKETIGESIDINKHEELVMKALQKAKNERFI